jgi:hypothetical protein
MVLLREVEQTITIDLTNLFVRIFNRLRHVVILHFLNLKNLSIGGNLILQIQQERHQEFVTRMAMFTICKMTEVDELMTTTRGLE